MKTRLLSLLCFLLISIGCQAQNAEFETAVEAVKNMKIGWNLVNTLDSHSGGEDWGLTTPESWETAWGNPVTKPELLKMIRKAGFGTMRIPVTWFPHTDRQGNIDAEWMKRVHEVVDYVIDQGMYCILNTHHETGTTPAKLIANADNYRENKDWFENVWRQIANEFKDYDQHLLFEGYNEMVDETGGFCFPSDKFDETHVQEAYQTINDYAQSFVNAVRATGGNNLERNLIVNPYSACVGPVEEDWCRRPYLELKIPNDVTKNHIIFGIHCYWMDKEEDARGIVNNVSTCFTSRGVPTIISEYGIGMDNLDIALTKQASENCITPIIWNHDFCDGIFRKYPAFDYADKVEAALKTFYGDWYEPTLLTTSDYNDNIKVAFKEYDAELGLFRGDNSPYSLDECIGFRVVLKDTPEKGKLQINAWGEKGLQFLNMHSKSATIIFDKSQIGEKLPFVTLQSKYSGSHVVEIDSTMAIFTKEPFIRKTLGWSHHDCDVIYTRKQFVHTVEYDYLWAELNIFADDVPLKLKNYKGIRVELAEMPKDVHIKVYGDKEQKEDYIGITDASATILFNTDIFSNEINRVTLQRNQEGKGEIKVVGAWLIRQDGTEEYSELSTFHGCEVKDVSPYSPTPVEPVYNTFDRYLGGDLSLLPRFEQEGKTYLDDQGNKVDDVLRFLKEEKQFNSIRIRLFVDPNYAPEEHREWGAIQDMEMVKALGKRIKDLGMAFMLDFHYSDTWADPGKQYMPHAWEGLSDEELYTAIYEYTKNSLRELIVAGATPDLIQIGNEIDNGMLWADHVIWGTDEAWTRFVRLLKEASRACREVCPKSKIIIHRGCSDAESLQNLLEHVKEVDYDIAAVSFYLEWTTFEHLRGVLDMTQKDFSEKEVMVVETNYPYKEDHELFGYPCTEDGQNNYLNDLIKMLWEYPQVTGLYWWLPEGFRQGLWSEETGKPLAALSTMATFLAQPNVEKADVTDKYLINPTFDSDLHGWTNTGGTAKWREHTWEALSNYCEFEWTGGPIANQEVVQTITLPAGSYRLSVTCASDPGSSGLYLIAGSYSKEMPGTGGVDSFSLDFNVAEETAINIGMKVENTTATWVNFDNFKLERPESITGMHVISASPTKNNAVINLWGQKLAKPQKGINIIDGKKVIVK